jgi:cytochrome P450
LLILIKILVTTIYNLFFHPLARVPGPFLCRISALPSFYHALKRDRHVWFWQQFQLYGGKVRAAPNLVVFNSPNAYNSIFSHKANVKRSKFYDTWSRNADDVNALMTSDVEVHAKKRRLLNLAFTERSVKAAGPFIAKHTDRWNELLLESKKRRDDGWSSPQEISTWTMYLVFDILMDLCFWAAMDTKEPGENPLKKIPQAFDDFVTYNYPVSNMFYVVSTG